MIPDATKHNPDPAYLNELIGRIGVPKRQAAIRIGISLRLLQQYTADRSAASAREAPYAVQFALEMLAAGQLFGG